VNPPNDLKPSQEMGAARASLMMGRTRVPLRIAMGLVGSVVVAVPIWLGLPSLSLFGVAILGLLVLSIHAIDRTLSLFRTMAHGLYFLALVAVAYAVFGLGLPPVITVYFPAIVLLGAAYMLSTRAAIAWGIPCVALVGAAAFFPPSIEREVGAAVTFGVRAVTLLTILTFAVSFRRSHDRQAAELLRFATTDALTGLSNRREFERVLIETLGRAERFDRHGALVFADLDGLKKVNDRLGHEAGDELIRCTAQRIARHTRVVDKAARLGGDEFVVLLSEFDDPKGAEAFARKLIEVLSAPATLAGEPYQPSVSLGVALFPDAADKPQELVRQADEAMYQAKRAGGSRIFLRDDNGARDVT
jgi:diguanylate cyclase (GGDEF)-like protein